VLVATDTELAYIAGLIDGEGYIGIKRSQPYQHLTGRVNPGYHARLCIKMVEESAIRFLAETLGGWYFEEKRPNGGLSKRRLFSYQATDKAAAEVLRAVLPYLRVKRANAEAVLELRAMQENARQYRTKVTGERDFLHWTGKPVKVRNMAYSDEYIAICDALWQRCKDLNHGEAA
jgi:hypothetical protein